MRSSFESKIQIEINNFIEQCLKSVFNTIKKKKKKKDFNKGLFVMTQETVINALIQGAFYAYKDNELAFQ